MFSAATKTDNVSSAANYIEDVFSTYLYTGNGSTQTITNGIDLATYGGLVWIKARGATTPSDHYVEDTVRGAGNVLSTNLTDTSSNLSNAITSFNSTGFSLGNGARQNPSGISMASWTFRKQAKFFDVVTYTGDGNTSKTVSHSLGSVPGMMIIKSTTSARDWAVYYGDNTKYLVLNLTNAAATTTTIWNDTSPTSTQFTVGNNSRVNESGQTYVAYLFANNAGGFGAAGTDNVISCGSYTGNGSATGTVVTLGYEPQWLMIKRTNSTGDWVMLDVMRGFSESSDNELYANLALAEGSGLNLATPQATGFQLQTSTGNLNASGSTYIYIAIRRGPMKTPTSGTSVFSPVLVSQTDIQQTSGGTFPPDFVFMNSTNGTSRVAYVNQIADRLRSLGTPSDTFSTSTDGVTLVTSSNAADDTSNSYIQLKANGIDITRGGGWNAATFGNFIYYLMRRSPGFLDVVCYTGTGSATTQTHNLGAAPELLIVKSRDTVVNWVVWASAPTPQQNQYALNLNTAGAWGSSGDKNWGATLIGAPNMTSTTFSLGDYVGVNGSAKTYVAYLFASCTGVSKVGSYTGTGALQTINCGFASGARFVLIKRTDSTGDWWTYDSARGITSGNDPYLFLNSTAAEVTNTNYVDTASTGFQVTAAAPAGLNANGGTYIFLAIA